MTETRFVVVALLEGKVWDVFSVRARTEALAVRQVSRLLRATWREEMFPHRRFADEEMTLTARRARVVRR